MFNITKYMILYDKLDDPSHGRDHIYKVLKFSIFLGTKYLKDDNSIKLLVPAAVLHDIGLYCGNRDNHHITGSEFIKRDTYINSLYKNKEIDIICCAIKEHRASCGNPKTILEKIISDADRVGSECPFNRSYKYLKNKGGFAEDYYLYEASQHMLRKFDKGKYGRKCYFKETEYVFKLKYDPIINICKNGDINNLKNLIGEHQKKGIE